VKQDRHPPTSWPRDSPQAGMSSARDKTHARDEDQAFSTTRSGRPQSPAEASVTGVLRFARSARGRSTPLVAAGG
jgi:hypothetical protein